MLLSEGKLIDAIKSLRTSHNLWLRQAKDWVDWHIAQDPALRERLETQQRVTRRKLFMWFLVVDAAMAAGLIYYFLRGTP